jgi:hypothetical protein
MIKHIINFRRQGDDDDDRLLARPINNTFFRPPVSRPSWAASERARERISINMYMKTFYSIVIISNLDASLRHTLFFTLLKAQYCDRFIARGKLFRATGDRTLFSDWNLCLTYTREREMESNIPQIINIVFHSMTAWLLLLVVAASPLIDDAAVDKSVAWLLLRLLSTMVYWGDGAVISIGVAAAIAKRCSRNVVTNRITHPSMLPAPAER